MYRNVLYSYNVDLPEPYGTTEPTDLAVTFSICIPDFLGSSLAVLIDISMDILYFQGYSQVLQENVKRVLN
jgi:hypothetical protein